METLVQSQQHEIISLPSITIRSKTYKLQDRISIESNIATIKYIGSIPQWPNYKAIGVEWDDPVRGKNNGTLNDIRYFNTLNNLNSASFIKLTDKKIISVNSPRSFFEALVYNYGATIDNGDNGDNGDDVDVVEGSDGDDNLLLDKFKLDLGSKVLKSYGFEKLSKIQSNFKNLHIISLNHFEILNEIGISNIELIQMLSNLEILDLSFNLFNDWNFIIELISCLPKLNNITLNGNRFIDDSTICLDSITEIYHIKKVSLASCALSFNSNLLLKLILTSFPYIEEISLARNCFNEYNLQKLIGLNELRKLKKLDLSFSNFNKIDFNFMNSLNYLENINFSNNEIQLTNELNQMINFKIISIDLTKNRITNWFEIDILSKIFPNLSSLKISDNPIFQNSSDDYDYSMMQLISRLPNLYKINGTEYTEEERQTYELYFISKVKSQEINYDNGNENWLRLCKKYNIERTNSSLNQNKNKNKNKSNFTEDAIFVKIAFKNEGKLLFEQMLFPNSYTVGKLKGYISRKLEINVLDFQIFFSIDGTRNKLEKIWNNQEIIARFNLINGDFVYVELGNDIGKVNW